MRSWNKASCLRRNRFSAASARRDRETSTRRRTRSQATKNSVLRLCVSSWQMESGINVQLYTLRDVTRLPTGGKRNFCGPHLSRFFTSSTLNFKMRRKPMFVAQGAQKSKVFCAGSCGPRQGEFSSCSPAAPGGIEKEVTQPPERRRGGSRFCRIPRRKPRQPFAVRLQKV